MRDAVIELIEECEIDNGSIGNTSMFDKRLVETRKWFNDGIDPFDVKYYDFDFKSAQLMLDQGIDKDRISKELGVSITSLNSLILMGNLDNSRWLEIHEEQSNRTSKYILSRGHKRLATGTIKELSEFMSVPIGTIRYWKSSRYKAREHKVTYKILKVS